MIQIIKQRERIECNRYQLFFQMRALKGSGYMFDCDVLGIILDSSIKAYQKVKDQLNDREVYNSPVVEILNHSYVEPAIGLCHCGSEVTLSDPMDNDCRKCGRIYNSSGQEVNCHARDADEPYDEDF